MSKKVPHPVQRGGIHFEKTGVEEQDALVYIAFGAGVQSTALLIMSAHGDFGIPHADVAIFSDTGNEPAWVYETVEWYRRWAAKFYIKVITVSAGTSISQDILDKIKGDKQRCTSIPAWTTGQTDKASPLRRFCTTDFKKNPIRRAVRELVGNKRSATAIGMLGISFDEAERMKDSSDPWIKLIYPLVDNRITREDCLAYIAERQLHMPKKSSCVFCPYHNDTYWSDLKTHFPQEFKKAVEFDKQIRDMTASGVVGDVYLHSSLQPLDQVVFQPKSAKHGLREFGGECEGMCGV